MGNSKQNDYRFTDSALRPFFVLRIFIPFLLSILRDFRRWFLFGAPRVLTDEQELARAQKFVSDVICLGPTYVKLGQILAMREDFIPRLYTCLLKDMHDKVPPFPVTDVHRIIEADFGRGVADLFDEFEPNPLAAASLGQVHRAVLHGKTVAVKVLRPGVEGLVFNDLRVMRVVLGIARFIFGRHFIVMNLTTIVDEFERMIRDEMNFEVEAKNADEIRANLRQFGGVRIPEIYRELLSQRVLTMEFVDGIRLDDTKGLIAAGLFPMSVMKKLIEVYMYMIAHNGVSHADPHPGNLYVDTSGNIVMFDFGMVLRLSSETRRELVRTVSAGARDDVDAMVRGFYKLQMVTPGTNMVTLRDAAGVILDITYKTQHSTSHIVQKMVTDLLSTFYRFPLHLPSNLVYLLRIATILEGIGLHYQSDFNGVRFARPIIRRLIISEGLAAPSEMLGDAAGVWKNGLEFVRGVDRIVSRIDREELKVGVHSSDMGEIEHYFAGVQRRMVFGMLALAIAMVSAIVFTATRSYLQLAVGELLAAVMFILLLVLPVYRRWK